MRSTMLALAVVAPGLVMRAANAVPHPMGPRADLLSTFAILAVGLFLVAGAIRSVIQR
jgi:hypothetical protein